MRWRRQPLGGGSKCSRRRENRGSRGYSAAKGLRSWIWDFPDGPVIQNPANETQGPTPDPGRSTCCRAIKLVHNFLSQPVLQRELYPTLGEAALNAKPTPQLESSPLRTHLEEGHAATKTSEEPKINKSFCFKSDMEGDQGRGQKWYELRLQRWEGLHSRCRSSTSSSDDQSN